MESTYVRSIKSKQVDYQSLLHQLQVPMIDSQLVLMLITR